MENKPETNYRWLILILGAATFTFGVGMPTMCLPVLFNEISQDLGLNLVQVGAIWGMGYLPGMVSGLIGGAIGDRFGTKRTLSVFCLLAGLAGASRGLTNGFISFSITAILFGFLFTAIPTNVHKMCGVWFSRKQLGLANGVASMGMALGFMAGSLFSASYLSPWLGGWRNVMFFYGAISICLSVLWGFTRTAISEQNKLDSAGQMSSFRQTFVHVIRVKNVWLLGITILGFSGCVQGMLGYLPLYLRNQGWAGPLADSVLGTFHGASMIAVLIIALLSDRVGKRKPVLIAAAIMMTIGTGMMSVVMGIGVWVAVLIAGVIRDGFMAVYMTTIIETKGIGASFAGTAIGLALMFSAIGSLLSPPVGNSLAAFNPELPFVFWSALGIIGVVTLFFVEE